MKLGGSVALLSFIPFALTLACTGESVETVDAGADSANADSSADAPCTSISGNLVQNPSFEIVSAGVLTGWTADSTLSLVQRKGDAPHCEAWAEVELPAAGGSSAPVYFGQDILVDPPLGKGTRLTASAWFRTLDANVSGALEVGVVSGPGSAKEITLPADGTFRQYSFEWTVPEDGVTKIWMAFASTTPTTRKIGVDHFTMVVTRP